MTPDRRIDHENEIPTKLEMKLVNLSLAPESSRPIEKVTDEDAAELRNVLSAAGFNLNLSPEGISSLKNKQFRSLDQGKGPALVEILGRERAEELFSTCENIANQYLHVQRFKTGGVGLGLKHTLTDLASLAILPAEDRARIVNNINQRVFYGYSENEKKKAALAFIKMPSVAEPKKKATVPVGSIIKLWDFMIDPSK